MTSYVECVGTFTPAGISYVHSVERFDTLTSWRVYHWQPEEKILIVARDAQGSDRVLHVAFYTVGPDGDLNHVETSASRAMRLLIGAAERERGFYSIESKSGSSVLEVRALNLMGVPMSIPTP